MTGAEATGKPVTSMTSTLSMRRAAVGAAVLLFLARSGVGQEAPPLTVETLKPVPTVVKSGEPFLQVYRVRFPDLIGEGRELIVLEDRMAPESVTVNPFEASSVDMVKRRVGDEHIWDFTYTMRLVNPTKGTYLVPSISVFWLLRDLGATIEESEVRLINTDEVFVSYVTTVTDDPVIDIRDAVELGSFTTRATVMKAMAWTVAPLPLVVWLVMFVRVLRRPKLAGPGPVRQEDDLEALEVASIPLSAGQARRQLRRHLKVLGAFNHQHAQDGQAWLAMERNLVISFKDLLWAELPELNPGDTPRDIKGYIERRVKEGSRKDALMTLASRMVVYQSSLEKGIPSPVEGVDLEARLLDQSLRQLRLPLRVWTSFTAWTGRLKGMTGAGPGHAD